MPLRLQIFGTQGKDLQLQDKIVVTQPYMLHPQGTVRHLWDGCLVRVLRRHGKRRRAVLW